MFIFKNYTFIIKMEIKRILFWEDFIKILNSITFEPQI